jgi:hypothetical protein
MRYPTWLLMGLALMAGACEGKLIDPDLPGGPGGTASAALAVRIGDIGFDQVVDLVADPDGSVYVAGTFTGSVDFNPDTGVVTALTSFGLADGFLAKYGPSGTLVWVARIGGIATEAVSSVARDAAGNLFLGGSFEGAADFDPGTATQFLTSVGGVDGYVVKFAPTGSLLWAQRFGGTSADRVTDVAVDAAGNVYAAGGFAGQADAQPAAGGQITSDGSAPDGFLLSLDNSGIVRWAIPVGGIEEDAAVAVTVTSAQAVVVGGTFRGTADFAPGIALSTLVSAGGVDAFVASYTTAGALQWSRALSGTSDETVQSGSLAAGGAGGIAVAGSFAGTTDFNPGPDTATRTSLGGTDWYLARLDATGAFQSVFSVGGSAADSAPSIAFDADGNLLATGSFRGVVDFDPGVGLRVLTSLATAGSDIFAARYTPTGGVLWVSTFGESTAAADRANAGSAIGAGPLGSVLVAGRFFGSPNFGSTASPFGLISLGEADGFLVQLTASGALARNP